MLTKLNVVELKALAVAAVAGLLLTACGHKEEAPVAVAKPHPKPVVAQPADATPAPDTAPPPPGSTAAPAPVAQDTVAPAEGDTSAEGLKASLEKLNAAVGGFESELQRHPSGIEELMRTGFLMTRLPVAPDGKKFWYDTKSNQIVLTTRQPGEVDPEPLTPEQAREAATQTAIEIRKMQEAKLRSK